MDPLSALSLVVNIAQVIDGVAQVIGYVNDVKGAPADRARLARECATLLEFLVDFRYKVEESSPNDPWFSSARLLTGPDGPLEEFKTNLDELLNRLKPTNGLKRVRESLVWTFDMRYINKFILRVERLKAFMNLARQEDHFALSLEIKNHVKDLSTRTSSNQFRLEELKEDVERGRKDRERRDIIAWISTEDHSIKQRDLFARCEEGTGEWIKNHTVFRSWLGGESGTLWCPGGPGTGKTIMMSLVVDTIKQLYEKHDAIAYMYFNYKEQAEQTIGNVLASLLQQLVRKDAIISEQITSAYHHHVQNLTRPSVAEWSTLLDNQIGRFSRVFILVDALDECSEKTRDDFIAELQQLQPFINLLITSRPTLAIETDLPGAARLDIQADDGDIRTYLRRRIERERRLRRLLISDLTLQERIVEKIVENSKGMFLLAQLQMNAVTRKNNRRDIQNALLTLPKELNYTYNDAMHRIRSQSEEDVVLAEKILCWILYAVRPLTLPMLQHAVAVEPSDMSFDEAGIPDEEFMVSVCAGLVTVDQESQTIRLVHYTAQEYFDAVRGSRFPHAQVLITTTCLTYLSFNDFITICKSNEDIGDRLDQYPLLGYAAQHWGDHAHGEAEESVRGLAMHFLSLESNLFGAVQVMHYFAGPVQGSQETPTMVTGLHLAASFGLSKLVQYLLELKKFSVNLKDSLGRTALTLATENGHASVVLQLARLDEVDINIRDIEDRTPLLYAAENGNVQVVECLLRHRDIDVNTKDKYYGQTPLWLAVDNGHHAIVQLLLNRKDIDPNSPDEAYGHSPLRQAVERGYEEIVRILLQKPQTDVNLRDKYYGRTPLYEAADRGDAAIVRLLLELGDIDTEALDLYNGNTPLWQAGEKGHESVVHILSSLGGPP